MVNAFTAAETSQNLVFLRRTFGRKESHHRLDHGLPRRAAQHAFGTAIFS